MKKKYELKFLRGYHPRIEVSKDFVVRNNLKLVRTEEEILKRIEDAGPFDFVSETLVDYLSWEKAKQFYIDDYVKKVEAKELKKPEKIVDIYETAQDFLDYMVFGWKKAIDKRGLSASRTIYKLGHWLWLMGRDDLSELIISDELYNPYGVPALIMVCEKMGIKVPKDLVEFKKTNS